MTRPAPEPIADPESAITISEADVVLYVDILRDEAKRAKAAAADGERVARTILKLIPDLAGYHALPADAQAAMRRLVRGQIAQAMPSARRLERIAGTLHHAAFEIDPFLQDVRSELDMIEAES